MNEASDQPCRTEREIFLDAMEIACPRERDAFLVEACGGDTELRASVEALIENARDDEFMQTAAMPLPPSDSNTIAGPAEDPIGERVGDRLGVYRLLQKIGEGGVGIVYLAEQEEPVRRRVAIKVLKPGLETKSVIARFESESQALALMESRNFHPHLER